MLYSKNLITKYNTTSYQNALDQVRENQQVLLEEIISSYDDVVKQRKQLVEMHKTTLAACQELIRQSYVLDRYIYWEPRLSSYTGSIT